MKFKCNQSVLTKALNIVSKAVAEILSRVKEEKDGSWKPAHIKITAHPLVHIEKMDKHEQKEAQAAIEATIRSAL